MDTQPGGRPTNTVRLDIASDGWVVRNEQIECQVHIVEGRLVWSIGHAGTNRLQVGPSGAPHIAVDGVSVAWTDQATASERSQSDGSKTLRVDLDANERGVRISHSFQVFPDRPFVRVWGTVENRGDTPVTVTDSEIVRLRLRGQTPLTLFHVEQFSWVYRHDFFSQHQVRLVPGRAPVEIRMGAFPSHFWEPTSCAWLAVRDGAPDVSGEPPNAGLGLVVGIEFNGKSRLHAWATDGTTHLTSNIDELHHQLAPGAIFEIPACFIGLFEGDWDEAGYVTQRFAEAYVHPPMPDERYPWVQYNSWRYEQNIDEAQQLAAIERCAELGVEVAVMDLGWAKQIGDWHADPAKFPHGLGAIAERAHALGLKFGVHIPLAQAHPESPVAQAHPDWLIHTGDDYFGAAPLCLGHQPCRDWLAGEILRLIDEYRIDYFVQDGEDMVKRCHKTTHTHTPGDSNYANSTQGLDVVIETVRRLRPHVIWENCEDGGCMLTYKMARLYHSTITVDNIATYATRQGIYGASYPFSPRYSVRYMQDDPTPYTLRSAIFGGPLILMQRITEWNDEQMRQTKAAIARYKELRTLIRDAKIVHLLPPRYNVAAQGWGWDAIQAVSPDQTRSVVLVYRALGDTPHKTIRARGLRAEATYRIRLEDRGDLGEMNGAALAHTGIELRLEEFAAEMIHLELVAW